MADEREQLIDRNTRIQDSAASILREDPNALAQVFNPETGRYERSLLRNTRPVEQQVLGISGRAPHKEFGGKAAGIRTAGRSLINTLGFGLPGLITDRFLTEQEREKLKKEQEFHPGAETLGALGAYAGALLESPITGAVRLGTMAAERLLPAEASTVTKWMTQGAIDGLAAGFTQGMNEVSLNDASIESIAGLATSSLLGFGSGAFLGAAMGKGVEALSPATQSAKRVLSRMQGKPVDAKWDPVADVTAAKTTGEQRALNQNLYTEIVNRATALAAVTDPTAEQLIESRFLYHFLQGLDPTKHPDLVERIMTTGEVDLADMFRTSRSAQEAVQAFKTRRPSNPIIKEFGESANETLLASKQLRQGGRTSEIAAAPEAINNEVPREKWGDIHTEFVGAEDSLHARTVKELEELADKKKAKANLQKKYPLASEKEIEHAANDVTLSAPKKLVKKLLGAVGKVKLELKNASTPAAVWEYLDKAQVRLTDAWFEYKASLPAGTYPSKVARELYTRLKTEYYEAATDASKFGKTASNRAISHNARAEVDAALKKVERYLGKDLDVVKFMGQVNKLKAQGNKYANLKYSYFIKDWNDFMVTLQKNAKVLGEIPGMENYAKAMEEILPRRQARMNKLWEWNSAVNDERSENFRAAMAAGAGKEAGGYGSQGVGGPGRLFRISHFIKDVAVGNTAAASIQATRMAMDETQRLLQSIEFFGPKTMEENMVKQLEGLRKLREMSKRIDYKGRKAVSSLAKRGGIVGVGSQITLKALPYGIVQHTNEGKKKIDQDFKTATDNLGRFTDPAFVMQQTQAYQNYKFISKDMDKIMSQKVIQTVGQVMASLPEGPDALEGDLDVTTQEKADWLDSVTAISDPETVFDYIANGSISEGMIQSFSQNYPALWQNVVDEGKSILVNDPSLGLEPRTRLMSVLGIKTMPVPITTPAIVPQSPENGQLPEQRPNNQSLQQMGKPRKITGKKVMSTKELVGNFSQTGGTGA